MELQRNQTKTYIKRGRAFFLLRDKKTVALETSAGKLIELDKIPFEGSVIGTDGKYYNEHGCKYVHIQDDDIYSVVGPVEKYEGMDLVVRGELFTGPILKSRALAVGQTAFVKYYAKTRDILNVGVHLGRTERTTSALGIDYAPVYESVINNQTWT